MREQPWNASKGTAVKWAATWLAIGTAIAWVGISTGYAGGGLTIASPFFITGGLYVWRFLHVVSRDQKNASLSYGETVYHNEAPTPRQPQNKLYVPKSPNQPR
jgi:hypothetical protein